MRVRVKFRYRADTGEVELYEVEDLREGSWDADHDARHDAVAGELARLVEEDALVEEVSGHPARQEEQATAPVRGVEHGSRSEEGRAPQRERRGRHGSD